VNPLKNPLIIIATLVLACLAASRLPVQAQGGVPLWTNRYNGPGNGEDKATAIKVDSSGNVFVTGYSVGSGSGSAYAFATIKYSNSGVPLWTNRYGELNSSAMAYAMAVGSNGNVMVTGALIVDNSDYATVAYSSAGSALWANRYNGPGNGIDLASSVVVDHDDNVIVTGYSRGAGTSYDYATIKYSASGVPQWTKRFNGAANSDDLANLVVVDSNGNVYVTGGSWNGTAYDCVTLAYSTDGLPLWTNFAIGFGGIGLTWASNGNLLVTTQVTNNNNYYNYDYATVSYSSVGMPLWTNRYNGLGNGADFPYAMTLDSNGNVFVIGGSAGNGSDYDYGIVAYSSTGERLWTNRYNGPLNSSDMGRAIGTDSSGNVIATGLSLGLTGHTDYATVAYSGAGVLLWSNRYDGPAHLDDNGVALAVDNFGNIFVTGDSVGNGSGSDYATVKYSSSVQPYLVLQKVADNLVLTWTNAAFNLQTAPIITGAFTNIPGAISPYTNSIISPEQYFRLTAP